MTDLAAQFPERLADLEIRLNLAEDLVDGLNQTVYRQQLQIDQLIQVIGSLREQADEAAPREFKSLLDELPPHY